MFLSIITINRNNAEGLKKTLESVASQTCRDFEHIIIDGASTDSSVDVIKDYVASPAGKNVSYWVSEPDSGVYSAMNKGIKKASGDYCQILNSGDWLFDVDTVQNEKNAAHTEDIVYFDPIFVFKNSTQKVAMPDKISHFFFLSGRTLNHQNELIKTSLQKACLYSENYKIFSDNEFNIKNILFNKVSTKHFSRTIAYYEGSEGISSTQLELLENEREKGMESFFDREIIDDYRLLIDYELGYMGRGYYHFDFVSNRILLDRESYDFGRPKWHLLDTLKVPSTYRNMQIVYSYDDGFHDDFNVSEEMNIEYYD